MSHFVEVYDGVQLDADNVISFSIVMGEQHLIGGKDAEKIVVDPRDLPYGSIGVIATGDGELQPVDTDHLTAYVYGNERTKLCYPLSAIVELDIGSFPNESDSLVFKDGTVVSLTRSTEPLLN